MTSNEFFESKGFHQDLLGHGIVIWERRGLHRHITVSNLDEANWESLPEITEPCLVVMYGNDGDGQLNYEVSSDGYDLLKIEALELLLDGLILNLDKPWIEE